MSPNLRVLLFLVILSLGWVLWAAPPVLLVLTHMGRQPVLGGLRWPHTYG